MIIDEIDITSLITLRALFEKYNKNITHEIEEIAAIKTFEMCFELSWKTMKRLLGRRGISVNSPREIIRDEDIADDIIGMLPLFSQELTSFLKNIGAEK